jgi:hypothetical protein
MALSATGPFGRQPCKRFVVPSSQFVTIRATNGRTPELAERVSHLVGHEVQAQRLRRLCDGHNAPHEYKIAAAQVLGLRLEECWTPAMLAAPFTGPRGVKPKTTQEA